jgi:hypothetical protein
MRTDRLLVALVTALVTAGASAALYKWVDEKGRIQYSDKPPAGEKGGVEMSRGGVIKKTIEGSATPEQKKAQADELARRKAEEQKALEQRRQDLALMQSYTTEKEIDLKRDREVQALEATISNLQRQARGVDERLAEDRARADGLTKTKKPLPDTLKGDLERLSSEKGTLAKQIAERQQEVVATKQKYEEYRRRFVELKQDRSSTFEPVSGPTPGRK